MKDVLKSILAKKMEMPEPEMEQEVEVDEKEELARELISAINEGDAKGVVESVKALMLACSDEQ